MSHIGPLVVVVDIGCGIGRDHEPHREDYNPRRYGPDMPTGLKATSSVVPIGFRVVESAANTFTETGVDLNLSALDREVFVVLSINMDPSAPDQVAGSNTATEASLTTTSQTGVVGLNNSNCLASARLDIRSDGGSIEGVPFSRGSGESPATNLDYIGIVATNDFFVQIEGQNNINAKVCNGKLYGYRARATADIYSALVQSEVLSA